jgi:hypothetical protein
MAIKHLIGKTVEEMNIPRVPFWKRTEYWRSPLALILILGFIIYGISYAIFLTLKWVLFSWLRPFSNSIFFCKIGFHKYRKLDTDGVDNHYCTNYICEICKKNKQEYNG